MQTKSLYKAAKIKLNSSAVCLIFYTYFILRVNRYAQRKSC